MLKSDIKIAKRLLQEASMHTQRDIVLSDSHVDLLSLS